MTTNLPLSGPRLWSSLLRMAEIGATPKGGCDRQTLTDADAEARALLATWAAEVGLTLTVDRLGTMILRRPGRDPTRPPVAIGSHLDTQPTGGKFDGVLGVLAGLEIMRALHEAGAETAAPLLLINWTNEEGARFAPPMQGSGVAMGLLDEATILAATDPAGAAFGAELARIGWSGPADPADLQSLGAYFELHIEQGPTLEAEGLEVGVVTGALAQAWYDVTVIGDESHGGSAMAGRHDALVAAAHLVTAVERIALTTLAPDGTPGRGTVGRLDLHPGSRNVAPGRTRFSVDFRHADPAALAAMADALRATAATLAAERALAIEVTPFWDSPVTPFDPTLVARVRAAATARGRRHRDMPTGIGHDAVYVARRCPAAMVFVPCTGGISHNEAEHITPDWATAGLEVLADAVLATAGLVPTP